MQPTANPVPPNLGRGNPTVHSMTDYTSDEVVELSLVEEEKDLGIWIISNLKPSLHCFRTATRATQMPGQLKRSFKFLSKSSFLMLYKTFVRPTLEYCTLIWNPYFAKDIDVLKNVQRHATKLLPSITSLPYKSRLRYLNIYSLYCRWQRGDLIETYKLLHNYYNTPCLPFPMKRELEDIQ